MLLGILLALLLASCLAPKPVIPPTATPVQELVFVIHPTEEDSVARQQFAPLIAFLSSELGVEIELKLGADYAAVVEAMKYGHADIARLGPFSYVLGVEEAGIEAVASGMKAKLGSARYQALIITRADRDISDLNGKSFAFVDVGSTSGYLVPATYIEQEGIELADIFYAGSHPAVIQAVKNGTVDAGGIADNRLYTALEEGVIEEGEIATFWTSDPIPCGPIAVQGSMDPALKERVRQAFLAVPTEVMEDTGLNEIGFEPMSDGDYDVIREIQETLGLD